LLTPGQAFVIPPDVPHSGRAHSACRVLDVFAPVRDDYR
jgi:quercetin dioxygenase-like cupin family protein